MQSSSDENKNEPKENSKPKQLLTDGIFKKIVKECECLRISQNIPNYLRINVLPKIMEEVLKEIDTSNKKTIDVSSIPKTWNDRSEYKPKFPKSNFSKYIKEYISKMGITRISPFAKIAIQKETECRLKDICTEAVKKCTSDKRKMLRDLDFQSL